MTLVRNNGNQLGTTFQRSTVLSDNIGAASMNVDGTAAQTRPTTLGAMGNEPSAPIGVSRDETFAPTSNPLILSGKVWSAFMAGDIVSDVKQKVTEAVWSTGTGSLKTFFTSSTQSGSSGDYYYDVYHANPTSDSTAAVQFAISYGHRLGSGSNEINSNSNVSGLTPSRAIYSQYRNVLLDPTDDTFELSNGKAVDGAVFIAFNRARYKERVDPGNWQLSLSGSNGSITTLIDDYTPTANDSYAAAGATYNVVSGSIANGIYSSAAPVYYGLVYPDLGTVVIDSDMLNYSASVAMVTSSGVDCNNHGRTLSAISGAAVLSGASNDIGFQVRNEQEITSTYYFVRIKNGEYNFTNNSTFTTGSYGDIRHPEMYNDPRVYITTVGLYDNANQLLAVAKLSRPLQKSFSRESLIRLKLDF